MKNLNEIKVASATKNSLIAGMHKNTSYGRTENGALTYTRTQSALLDFFAQAGAMRGDIDRALKLFQKAFSEDREKAIRVLFYLRDVRGGQGERKLFRVCLQWIGETYEDVFEKIVEHVPEYGRYDDLFFDNKKCFSLIRNQIEKDLVSENPSLLAKWLPTANASSPSTRAKAKVIAKGIGMNDIEYRKKVREIRKKIKTVEEQMSANKWAEVEYTRVPSQANRIYKNAFKKHDEERYNAFITKAEKGEVKINASTLYPYQIYNSVRGEYDKTLEALWNQLPDYTQGKNALVMADVSGSMIGQPMSVSVSLALYFAERNKGQFQNYYLTFSSVPVLQEVKGKTLLDKINFIEKTNVGYDTNIQAAFDLVLRTGIQNNVPQEEMPETIYIISDMEFNDSSVQGKTNLDVIRSKYEQAGYKIPNIVFWNVDSRNDNLPARENEYGVALVSGFSPSTFKLAVENKTPLQVMEDVINSERYSRIVL